MRKRDIKRWCADMHTSNPVCEDLRLHWIMLDALITEHCRLFGSCEALELVRESCTLKRVSSLINSISSYNSHLLMHMRTIDIKEAASGLQIVSLLKKFPFGDESDLPNPRSVAKTTFESCENSCSSMNVFFESVEAKQLPRWVFRARQLISDVLGELTPSLIMNIISDGSNGPGSTLSSNGNRVTAYYKYADFPYTVSKSASMYACAAISLNPRWMDILEDSGRRNNIPLPRTKQYQKELQIFWDCTDIADTDRVTFVPKDSRTDRPIAVGASLNVFLQLGVKTYMEERLKSVGIDLTNQEKNQSYAQLGSKFCFDLQGCDNPEQFSTIDLESASDTVSTGLVALLLPPDWFALLDDFRHKVYELDGESRLYQKFSGMGNGFTFPLETLIFWAICKGSSEDAKLSCEQHDIAVYGDDIVVRYKASAVIINALEWAGFTVNKSKTFLTGPFKESCGRDYFRGTNIRPFYLKRRVELYEDIYFVCNSLNRIGLSSPISTLYRVLCERCICYIPRLHRNYSPMDDNSDSGLCSPLSFARRAGFWPSLNRAEVAHAVRSCILDPEYIGLQCLYAVRFIKRPRDYRGRAKIRLMVALDREPKPSPWVSLKVEDVGRSTVTRRESFSVKTSLSPVSNWNGYRNPYELEHYFDQLSVV